MQVYGHVSLAYANCAFWVVPEKYSCNFCREDRNVIKIMSVAYTLACEWKKEHSSGLIRKVYNYSEQKRKTGKT